MPTTIIISGIAFVIIMLICITVFLVGINTRINTILKNQTYQYNLVVKMQRALQNKSATNAITENAEIIYQDLLHNLIPIMAAIDVMPRDTNEHQLWRALGGIMDEYAKNPFVSEKLRRCIKLDTEVARNIDNYINRADTLLRHLTTTDPNGILATTFTDGLLGQSVTFFGQAKQLAAQDNI